MTRAWILLSCLVISTLFRAFSEETEEYFHFFNGKPFLFSDRLLDKHSYTYFFMELVIGMAYALCIRNPKWLRDTTSAFILNLFIVITVLYWLHFLLWMRDEGPGFNIVKTLLFGLPLLYEECRKIWTRSKQLNSR